jgi:hypothetical protein
MVTLGDPVLSTNLWGSRCLLDLALEGPEPADADADSAGRRGGVEIGLAVAKRYFVYRFGLTGRSATVNNRDPLVHPARRRVPEARGPGAARAWAVEIAGQTRSVRRRALDKVTSDTPEFRYPVGVFTGSGQPEKEVEGWLGSTPKR